MQQNELELRLRNLVNNLKGHYKIKYQLPIEFYVGKDTEQLKKVIDDIAPFGKGVFFSKESKFESLNKRYQKVLNGKGVKMINFVVEDYFANTIENASGLFSLAEDVRFILFSDLSLCDIASYFAHFRKIPVIFIPESLNFANAFSSVIPLINGDKIDEVKVKPTRHVIIDRELIGSTDACECYADLVSLLPLLADYRINCSLANVKPNGFIYDLLKECLTLGYKAINLNKNARDLTFLYLAVQKAVVEGNSLDGLRSLSSVNNALWMLSAMNKESVGYKMQVVIDIVNLYSVCFEKGNLLQVPNYNDRVEAMALIFNMPEDQFISYMNYQTSVMAGKTEKIDKLKKQLNVEYKNAPSTYAKIYKNYLSLGGVKATSSDFTNVFNAVKFAGDCARKVNGMALVRESGMLERYMNEQN